MTQIDVFQRTGQVASTCNGACNESADAGIPIDAGPFGDAGL
jgi:hypothetical protein